MYIQVIEGHVRDAGLLDRQMERWRTDIKPGAAGFLGSTSGVTADGTGITLVRFESEAAARANSERAEQGEWWNEASKAFDGDVTFYDCREVDTILGGGSDEAGFVQVIEGRAKDEATARARITEMAPQIAERRPDLLGITVAWHGDGGFTQAAYFRSEAEAREHEKATADDPMQVEYMDLFDGPPRFFDLTAPEFE